MTTLKNFMGIENEKLTDKQVAIILWVGFSAIITALFVCIMPALPTALQFIIGIPVGLNLVASMTAMPQAGIRIKE